MIALLLPTNSGLAAIRYHFVLPYLAALGHRVLLEEQYGQGPKGEQSATEGTRTGNIQEWKRMRQVKDYRKTWNKIMKGLSAGNEVANYESIGDSP
ncbi:hypothetical protein WUBG_16157 [Wuchereria bancrofti]|uniref:Uncharacterized protein n=1 Tax=Wuchereria bancrofti TaxID=6293 RepID=J9AFU3_WUCBA|nr:hypothetical protein WUBG_16157 [Wuchereria bancrofti]